MSDLYDIDILTWSEHQADLLRRLAAGEPVNEAPDWVNIIEEVEDLGRSALRIVRSHLIQALLHDIKVQAWPRSPEVPHWRAEARLHRMDAADEYTPSMAKRIDVAALYRKAMKRLPDSIDGQAPLPVSETCRTTLDELLAAD